MSRTNWLTVYVAFGKHDRRALVRGEQAREVVSAACGRLIEWSPRPRGWLVADASVDDVVAAAEAAGIRCTITARRPSWERAR